MNAEKQGPRDAAMQPGAYEATIDRILQVGTRIAVLAGILLTVTHFGNEILFDGEVDALNANVEGNTATWASVVATFAAAFAALLGALLLPWNRPQALAIAAIVAYFSLDDLVRIHESLEGTARTHTDLPGILVDQTELIVLVPLFAAAVLLIWRLAGELAPRIGRTLRLGLLLLVTAIASEFLGTGTRKLGVTWINDLRKGLEEALELAGWIMIATALTAALCAGLLELSRRAASASGSDPASKLS